MVRPAKLVIEKAVIVRFCVVIELAISIQLTKIPLIMNLCANGSCS